MTEPSVCAVMLTANRPEFARQAVECFRRQTYLNKMLLMYDTGDNCDAFEMEDAFEDIHVLESTANRHSGERKSIGYLRNRANAGAPCEPDILIHWDDDDYSHPNRIAEQVALLQSSGADCVGYNEMLFWREPQPTSIMTWLRTETPTRWAMMTAGEAWLYSQPNPSYALGTSLCCWRRTWERRPFEATSVGEDVRFISGLKIAAVSSITPEPRMIARIHSGNTSNAYRPEAMARASEWKRVPEWDSYCREVFKCA